MKLHDCGWCGRWRELRGAYEDGMRLEVELEGRRLIERHPGSRSCPRHWFLIHWLTGPIS